MKRILAMILSFIFALLNDSSFVVSEKPLFGADKYYMFEDEYSLTDQELIDMFNKKDEQSRTTSIKVGGAKVVQSDSEHRAQGRFYFKVVPNETTLDYEYISKHDNAKGVFTWGNVDGEESYIVCPMPCYITTNFSSDNSGGRDLTLESTDGKYRFEFSNLERRFTELTRTPPDDGEDWTNCGKVDKNYILPAGFLVGIAQSNTQLTIKYSEDDKTWSPCSLVKLYFKDE